MRTFPHYRSLALGDDSLVGRLGEGIQSLFKGLASGVQVFLCSFVLVIAVSVKLIATSAEER